MLFCQQVTAKDLVLPSLAVTQLVSPHIRLGGPFLFPYSQSFVVLTFSLVLLGNMAQD